MRFIRTAHHSLEVKQFGGYKGFITYQTVNLWPGSEPNWQTRGEPIEPCIINSSWAVQCPCCTVLYAYEPGYPFYCPNCLSADNDGFAREVRMPQGWPNESAWTLIEQELLKRPNPKTVVWQSGETAEDIRRENKEHGVN